jgi:pyridoxine 4-dehydrogenase
VVRSQIEDSFERLRAKVIGLYYLHRVDLDTPLEESLAVIKDYVDQGRILHVGVSEANIEQVERARKVVHIAAVQNHYNLSERKHEAVVDYCESEGIPLCRSSHFVVTLTSISSTRSPEGTAERRSK